MENSKGARVLSVGDLRESLDPTSAETINDFKATTMKFKDSRLSIKSQKYIPTTKEMIVVGMKNSFNMTSPKFGIKEYACRDTMNLEPYYKIPNMAVNKKKGGKDHAFDLYA